jgi:hypothetical protein
MYSVLYKSRQGVQEAGASIETLEAKVAALKRAPSLKCLGSSSPLL